MTDERHIPYVMEEPPLDLGNPAILRDYLSRELKRIQNSHVGVDLDVETRWEDLRVPITAAEYVGQGNDPNLSQFLDDGAGSGGVFVYNFDPDAMNELMFTCQLPHGYKEGTSLRPHVHWSTAVTAGAGQAVVWKLEYTYAPVFGAFPVTQTMAVTSTASAPFIHRVSDFGELTASLATMSAQFICRLYRDGANGDDTFTASASLIEIDFHFQLDSHGSRKEYVK